MDKSWGWCVYMSNEPVNERNILCDDGANGKGGGTQRRRDLTWLITYFRSDLKCPIVVQAELQAAGPVRGSSLVKIIIIIITIIINMSNNQCFNLIGRTVLHEVRFILQSAYFHLAMTFIFQEQMKT